jgi:tripartite ATP-independent transporter DctM subunit
MIIYAAMAETSVVQLFVSGIVPGLLGGLLMMGVAYWFAVRYNLPVEETFQWKRVWATFKDALWAFVLPFIILGGIFGGVVTATEGAALAVVAALFVGLVLYRELNVRDMWHAMIEGGVQTSVVMLLVAASAVLGTYLTEAQLPQHLAAGVLDITHNKYVVLALLNVLLLFLGLFLHSAAAIILVVPVVMPLVHAVGIDPVHFGIIVTINLGIGQQTPPMASVLATTCAIAKADMWEVTKVNIYFIAVLVLVLLLVTYVPVVPMWLVHLFYNTPIPQI